MAVLRGFQKVFLALLAVGRKLGLDNALRERDALAAPCATAQRGIGAASVVSATAAHGFAQILFSDCVADAHYHSRILHSQ